jgi:proteic killer suppression protein
VAINFFLWQREVEAHGLSTVQKIPGYHDEPLQGKLKGVRSVRLGLGYRAFYRLRKDKIECVYVEEVNKHDYKAIERLFS